MDAKYLKAPKSPFHKILSDKNNFFSKLNHLTQVGALVR